MMKKTILSLIMAMTLLAGCAQGTNTFTNTDDLNDGVWQYSELNNQSFEIGENKTMSIQFWIKPIANKTGTTIFSIDNGNDEYINLTSSGYTDGVYTGLTLHNNLDQWLCADGTDTLSTNRYNLITVCFNNDNTEMMINDRLVFEGDKMNLPSGKLTLTLGEEGYFSGLTVVNKSITLDDAASLYKTNEASVLIDLIDFPQADDQINDLWLVDNEIDGVPVDFKVDNEKVMNFQGVITRPTEDTTVTVSASIYTADSEAHKDFEVNILADTDETNIKRDEKCLDADITGVIHSNTNLPTSLSNGSQVSYKVTSNNAEINNGVITKTSTNEKEKVTFEATITLNNQTLTKTYDVILLDPIAGYIMSYFNGEVVDGEEKGKLAYSNDGLNWEVLNNGNPIITSELGNGRIRDPFITRDKNGDFVILTTEGFDNPFIYIIQTPDLIDLSNQQLVQVSYYDAGMQMTGTRAWAPEMYYDNENDLYYIYFSDNGFETLTDENTGHIYAVTSSDLNSFSYPFNFFNPGYTVIDGTIFNDNGKYWLFYKDERKAAQTIFYASSSDLSKGFDYAYDGEFLLTSKFMEGPFTFLNKDGSARYLYIDNYPRANFFVGSFTTLGERNDIKWLDENMYTLPEEDVRHGACIPVTQNELDNLIQAYN